MLHLNEMSQNFFYSITMFFIIWVCEQKLGYLSYRFYHFRYLTGILMAGNLFPRRIVNLESWWSLTLSFFSSFKITFFINWEFHTIYSDHIYPSTLPRSAPTSLLTQVCILILFINPLSSVSDTYILLSEVIPSEWSSPTRYYTLYP